MELRTYQREVIDGVSSVFRTGVRRVVVSAPCGAGKTECAIAMVQRTLARGKRAVMVGDRISIVDQTVLRFRGAGVDVGVLWADRTDRPEAPAVIASAQTVMSRGVEALGTRHLAIIDECHIDRSVGHSVVKAVTDSGGCAVGLTGTPVGPAFIDRAGVPRWDALVSGPTAEDLAAEGNAVIPVLEAPWSPEEDDLAALPTGTGGAEGEWRAGAAGELMARFTGFVVGDVLNRVKFLCGPGGELPRMLLLGATKAHVRRQLDAFRAAGVPCAEVLDDTKREDRKNRIAAFAAGQLRMLGSVSALSVGFDSPAASVLVGLRPLRRAVAEWMQGIGRIARPYEGKEQALVLDYSGNVGRFGEYVQDRWRSGWSALPTASPAKPKKAWECKACGTKNAAKRLACIGCGLDKPKGASRFPPPHCEPCELDQKPGATVCSNCDTPLKGRWQSCPVHGIPLAEGEEGGMVCLHPGCTALEDAGRAAGESAEGKNNAKVKKMLEERAAKRAAAVRAAMERGQLTAEFARERGCAWVHIPAPGADVVGYRARFSPYDSREIIGTVGPEMKSRDGDYFIRLCQVADRRRPGVTVPA